MRLFFVCLSLACLSLSAQEADVPKADEATKEAQAPPIGTPVTPPAVDKKRETSPTSATDKKAAQPAATDKTKSAHPFKPKKFGPGLTKDTRKKVGKPDVNISMARYIITMAVVLALLGLVFYILKRFAGKMGGTGYGSLNVIQRLQLDAKNTLVLVRCHEDEVLLAVGPNGTTLISKNAAIEGTEEELAEGETGKNKMETYSLPQDNSLVSKLFNGFTNKGGGQRK